MNQTNRYVRDADQVIRDAYEEPLRLSEYIERVFEDPSVASHASKYLIDAIEAAGTRPVIEEGETKIRYRFFDDPYNDGEHAVLGNTEMLNGFVDDLRAITEGRGKTESIMWFTGPTATGKSELKRCLINGLRAYSKTPEGRRYTLEWNLARSENSRELSYGSGPASEESNWQVSPVQVPPLSVFPAPVRTQLVADVNQSGPNRMKIDSPAGLDPFSQAVYDRLEAMYRRDGERQIFSKVTDERHLRVINYVMDVGQGIGVLTAEDSGTPKARLVGSWMAELFRDLESFGRKNPQAFSYDGVLSQGNSGVTIVEDASQHADLVQKLLSVPEEEAVKLDKGISMGIDTQLVIISNPDLEEQLNKHEDRTRADPLKALKRRLNKRSFRYLTTMSLEAELLRREVLDSQEVWELESYEARQDKVREAVTVEVRDSTGVFVERELAPHVIEAAALFDVVSRLDSGTISHRVGWAEKAVLFDQGYLVDGDERLEKEDLGMDDDSQEGLHGIPVTYTRDVFAEVLASSSDRCHPDYRVEDVVMPEDILGAMVEGFGEAPVFSMNEREEYENRAEPVQDYICEQQEADVVSAMLAEHRVDEDTVAGYVKHVYAWETGEAFETEGEGDPLTMKVFEIEHLGRFDESDYEGTEPSEAVASFRRDRVIAEINRQAWEQRNVDFEVGEIDFTAISVLSDVLSAADWDDVRRQFENFAPSQWADPPTGTETARLKEETIERLCAAGYSRASAQLTSQRVIDRVVEEWD